jgi:hypothetical protein
MQAAMAGICRRRQDLVEGVGLLFGLAHLMTNNPNISLV